MRRSWIVVVLLLYSGCGGGSGPGLVGVNGTITMDGKPLADASVTFTPDGAGEGGFTSPAYGKTDSNGYYFLAYSISKKGANPGKYKVSIRTQAEAEPDEGIKARPETVPAKYNEKSELVAEVKKGGGPYDFALDSQGEIVQVNEAQ